MAFLRRHSRPLLYTILSVAVLTIAGLFLARVGFAGLEWETQKPPEVYQNGSGVDFYKIDFQQNPDNDKYYGWVVGEDLSGKQSTLLHFNGAFWESIIDEGLGAGATKDLRDVSAVWNSDIDEYLVWAVGQDQAMWYLTDSEVVCHVDGIPCPVGPSVGELTSVEGAWYAGNDDVVIFVGNNGNIYHAVADDYASEFAYSPSTYGVNGIVRDIISVDATHAWAVTSAGRIYHKNQTYLTNDGWSEQANFSGVDLTGISMIQTSGGEYRGWASGVAGLKGRIYYYDGSTWTQQFETVLDIPLHDISAFYNPTLDVFNAFAVGEIDSSTGNGGIYQFNGSVWERQDSNNNGNALRGISAASLIEVRAVGIDTSLLISTPGNIFGWIWLGSSTANGSGDSLGWGSGSCANLDSCESSGFTYGVNIRSGGTSQGALSGHFWLGSADPDAYIDGDCNSGTCQSNSSVSCSTDFECRCSINASACYSTGWMSFNKIGVDGVTEEAGTPPAAPYNNGAQTYIARFDAQSGKVSGWGRLLSLSQDADSGGWVKLRGESISLDPGDFPLRDCKNCGKFCSLDHSYKCGVTSDCLIDTDGDGTPENYGTCSVEMCKICNADRDGTVISANKCSQSASSNACSSRCALDLSRSCSSDTDCLVGSVGPCIGETFCNTCESYDQYGVSIDDATGKITGFAWSGDATTYGQLGWIDFSRANYYSQAWLQTQFGNIYAQADVGSAGTAPAPQDKSNATYLITAAGTITNFNSSYTSVDTTDPPEEFPDGRPFIQQNYDEIYYPTQANNYTNVLGKLDPDGLVADVGSGKNKYGDTVNTITGNATLEDLGGLCNTNGASLNGVVYHVTGNLNITECDAGGTPVTELVIKNAAAGQIGSGAIVVDGNLTIDMNMRYETSPLSNIRELASLGVMVKGRMIVTGDVDNIVGSYIVFGSNPTIPLIGSGITIENSLVERSFTAQGLMIARGFRFERTYRGTLLDPQPAEQVVYDGRVIANTPPGFRDFAKVLPIIRETIPF